jgi:hypothetical protein
MLWQFCGKAVGCAQGPESQKLAPSENRVRFMPYPLTSPPECWAQAGFPAESCRYMGVFTLRGPVH